MPRPLPKRLSPLLLVISLVVPAAPLARPVETDAARVGSGPAGAIESRRPVHGAQQVGIVARAGGRPASSTMTGDELGAIVRLEGEPILRPGQGAPPTVQAHLAHHRAALDRVAGLITHRENEARRVHGLPARARSEVAQHQYTRVFNGLAVRVRPETFERLGTIPGVTGVWVDQEARATLTESVPLIQADRVWNQLGNTGADVRVAIIDTGVDYNHPDLGGCLEPDCKVYSGWDFVNNDSDPMDDFGHGTHVAGIVAASGTLTGVAPEARILAIKVLDRYGSGLFSDVIAGIELAVDPDGDPATADGAQVINLSLGGPGDPDDPVSQAVDTAVAAGVVVAVAAGNSGPDFETIGSPGCARLALTVGASDKTDVIAPFSSRGAPGVTYAIKPEILAPGVGITSTVPSGACFLCDPSGYLALDGTSMATPHVAGAAALVLSDHPGWTPAQVRSALRQRAVDLALGAYEQGSGRLDAWAALTHEALVDRPDFSAGRDNPALAAFSASQLFTLANLTSGPTDYALSVVGAFPPGLTVALDRTSLHLGGRQSGAFLLSLYANNALLPNVAAEPFAYEGAVVAAGATESLRLPFAVVKAPLLQVAYDQGPWTVVVHDRGAFFKFFVFPGTTLSTLAPPAPLDVVNLYGDGITWIVREGLAIAADTQIAISRAEAAYPFRLVPTDATGAPVILTRSMTVSHMGSAARNFDTWVLGDYGGNLGSPTTFHLSSMTNAYVFEASALQEPPGPGAVYLFHGGARDGVTGPLTFRNSAADFKHVTWRYTPEPGGTNVTPWTWFTTRPWSAGILLGFAKCDAPQGLAAPFQRDAWLTALPYPDYGIGYVMQDVFGRPAGAPCNFTDHLYQTPYLTAATPSRLDGYQRFSSAPSWSSGSPVLVSGIGPHSWTGRFANLPDQVTVTGDPWFVFMSQSKDVRDYPPLAFELSQGGAVVQTGSFNGSAGPGPLTLPVTPGRYRLRVPFTSFHVGGQAARAEAAAVFDTQSPDPNPPFLVSLELTGGGVSRDTVPAGGAEVRVVPGDDTGLADVSVLYKSGGDYLPASLAPQPGGAYAGTIPGGVAPAVVPMAVMLNDLAGNSVTYSFCTAATATPEVCNGLDDDCDGVIPAAEADGDGDLMAQCVPDCNDADPAIWRTPGEVTDLTVSGSAASVIDWGAPIGGVAAAMRYDVLRSSAADNFVLGATCLESGDGPNVTAAEPAAPAAGQAFYYLVRALNSCPAGRGSLGADSSGVERAGRSCP